MKRTELRSDSLACALTDFALPSFFSVMASAASSSAASSSAASSSAASSSEKVSDKMEVESRHESKSEKDHVVMIIEDDAPAAASSSSSSASSSDAAVETNPDECKYELITDVLCATCRGKDVAWPRSHPLSMWLECENDPCGKWYHARCVGITPSRWQEIKDNDEKWYCAEHRRLHLRRSFEANADDEEGSDHVKRAKTDSSE
jgi:hypothetical protein